MRIPRLAGLAGLALVCGCTEPTVPEGLRAHRAHSDMGTVTVLTQNLYVGADVDAVIGAIASPNPNDDVPALLTAIDVLQRTAFPARAGAIAGAIALARPHAVGLQEVSQLDIDLAALGLPVAIHLDFLAILTDSLAARGLHYAVAVKVRNIVAQPFPGIALVDYDVILVDADRVTVKGTGAGTYAFNLGIVAPGVDLKRGWTLAHVEIGGVRFAFANTHLESGDASGLADLRAAQAAELSGLLPADATVILLGDLNDVPGSPMYQVLQQAGFTDAWTALRHGHPGFTCCEDADLSNIRPALDRRLDYVLVRRADGSDGLDGDVRRIGGRPSERIAGPAHPIWPSDHAGVVLRLQ